MRSSWNVRYKVGAALCWIALLTTDIAAQPPEPGTHEVSVIPLWDQDESGKMVKGGVGMNLGCRVRFDDETWRLIKQHEKDLIDITIETPFLTDDIIRWLATHKHLRSVRLAPNFTVDPAAKDYAWNLMPLEALNRLERLKLFDMRVSDHAWQAIGRMRTLKRLSLYHCRIDSQGSLPLANLKDLQSMEVDFCNVDDRFFAGLHELPNLKGLYLGGGSPGKFTAAGLASLAKTNLKQLHVHSINFGSAEIDALVRISSLQKLEGIPDGEAPKFEKHPNLLKINKQVRSVADGSPFVDPHAPGEKRWDLQPSGPVEKSLPATGQAALPNQTDLNSKSRQSIPLKMELSGDTAGERVEEFAGRKDVLKSKASDKSDTLTSMSLEVQLPDDKEVLVYRPDRMVYFSLAVLPPDNGTARLIVRAKQRPQGFLFLGDLNQLDSLDPVLRDMIERKDGWIVLRYPLSFLAADTKCLAIELIVNANSSAEACWANPELQLESNVTYEELDPTKQTLFQLYLDRARNSYGRLFDAVTGRVMKEGIGIGWGRAKTSCLFSSDGRHVAIISRYHDYHPSNSSDFEHLWLFALKPFRQVQEAKSSRFTNIRFAEDNTALLFRSSGPPEISGK